MRECERVGVGALVFRGGGQRWLLPNREARCGFSSAGSCARDIRARPPGEHHTYVAGRPLHYVVLLLCDAAAACRAHIRINVRDLGHCVDGGIIT